MVAEPDKLSELTRAALGKAADFQFAVLVVTSQTAVATRREYSVNPGFE